MSAPKPELTRLTGDSEECPYCHANLVAGPIPEDRRENYGGITKLEEALLWSMQRKLKRGVEGTNRK